MSARRTYVLIVDQDGRSNTEPLREWLQEGWSICSMESRAYGSSGLAVGITATTASRVLIRKVSYSVRCEGCARTAHTALEEKDLIRA